MFHEAIGSFLFPFVPLSQSVSLQDGFSTREKGRETEKDGEGERKRERKRGR